jgi:hypothetical protein
MPQQLGNRDASLTLDTYAILRLTKKPTSHSYLSLAPALSRSEPTSLFRRLRITAAGD